MASTPTPIVQLANVLLAEMVLRAGDIIAQRDTGRLKQTYQIIDPAYPDAIGISVVFRPGANLDQLVQAGGPFPHNKVSYTVTLTRFSGVREESDDILPTREVDHATRNTNVQPRIQTRGGAAPGNERQERNRTRQRAGDLG